MGNDEVVVSGSGDFDYKECTQFTVCEEDSDCVSDYSCLRKCINDLCTVDDSILLDGSLKILTDSYPGETSWELKEKPDDTIISCGSFRVGSGNIEYNEDLTLCPNVEYEFCIYDSYGDGICCGDYGDGRYEVEVDDQGAEFLSQDCTRFIAGSAFAATVSPSFSSSVSPTVASSVSPTVARSVAPSKKTATSVPSLDASLLPSRESSGKPSGSTKPSVKPTNSQRPSISSNPSPKPTESLIPSSLPSKKTGPRTK